MSIDVARAHGGDAGGDPPPNPTRIPGSCESGNLFLFYFISLYMFILYILIFSIFLFNINIEIPTKRKGRGGAIGKDLDERRRKNEKPLEVMFCPRTYKVVGGEHAAFVRLVGTQIKTKVPGHYKSWESVPQQYKDQVLNMIKV